jgi:hypothetical protein
MVIMAGVDLLRKVLRRLGRKRGRRISDQDLRERVCLHEPSFGAAVPEVLYEGCRNPMLHSFALQNKRFRMTLMQGFSHGVIRTVRRQPDSFVRSVEGLYVAFVQAVKAYEVQLRTTQQAQENFVKMFDDYGRIGMQSYYVEPASA